MRKEPGVFRQQLARSRSGLGRRVGGWALSPADPFPSCSVPHPSPPLPTGTSLDPEVPRAPGAEGSPEMAEGHCPCKDQVARTCLAGRESCAAFPGLSGAGVAMKALSLAADGPVGLFDVNNNYGKAKDRMIFFHCSALPGEMLKGKGVIGEHLMFRKAFGPGTGVGIFGGSVRPMPLTVASMKTEDGSPWAFVTTGKVTTDNVEKGFFGTGFVFRPESGDANAMLNYMARNGYRHHVAFVEGDWSRAVAEALANYLEYPIDEI